jgi:hypothetical protein
MSSDVELNEIGVLKRREIEARLLAPIVDALGDKFGRQEVLEVVRDVVTEIARRQGRELATRLGSKDPYFPAVATQPSSLTERLRSNAKRTILQGSPACDFRFSKRTGPQSSSEKQDGD